MEKAKRLLKSPHKVIELKQKRYNGGARNEGLLHISDDVDYVWFLDSDDWLADENVLQEINDNLSDAPDVLFVGMMTSRDGEITDYSNLKYGSRDDAIQGWSGSCAAVIRKELATKQECLFSEGTLKEDRNHHCRICIYMDDFKCLNKPVYVWNKSNSKSVTTVRDPVKWKTSTIRQWADTQELWLSVKGADPRIDAYLHKRLIMTRSEAINGGDRQF